MANVQITGVRELLGRMDDLGKKQMSFAVAKAMTLTVRQAASAETAHINDVFDKPTPFTKRAIGFTPANKVDLTATVFVKDAQAKYLQAEAEGGTREFKTFEERFATSAGPMVALPGRGMQLNQYGNITKAKIKRIAADVNTNVTAKRFFRGVPKGHSLPDGIYARVNENYHIVPLLVFATQASYKKRFNFTAIGKDTITAQFETNLVAAWGQAVKTARR